MGRGCLISTQTKTDKGGEWAMVAQLSTRPDAGYLYARRDRYNTSSSTGEGELGGGKERKTNSNMVLPATGNAAS